MDTLEGEQRRWFCPLPLPFLEGGGVCVYVCFFVRVQLRRAVGMGGRGGKWWGVGSAGAVERGGGDGDGDRFGFGG